MPWLAGVMERRPPRVASVAPANKIARMAWVVLVRGETIFAAVPAKNLILITRSSF